MYVVAVVCTVYRLEFQYGFSVPVSQLEGVRGRLRPALRVCCRSTNLHARKPQILPRGKPISLNCWRRMLTYEIALISPESTCICGIFKNALW